MFMFYFVQTFQTSSFLGLLLVFNTVGEEKLYLTNYQCCPWDM